MTIFHSQHILAPYTSWRIGGPAAMFAEATTPDEIREALMWANQREMQVALLGGGTNTLALDHGFAGLVLRYRDRSITIEDSGECGLAILGAGIPMAGSARKLAKQGWAGLEWAEGLPGTLGGAVFGNAGCYGSDMAACLTRAWVLVGDTIEEWPLERMRFVYRGSVLRNPNLYGRDITRPYAIILAAEVRLQRVDPAELAERMRQTAEQRQAKTPAGQSCGSVFKNPSGASAGRLIEAAGLKGTRIGTAEIAAKHANYIVNLGGASSDDILRLIELAQATVLQQFGIELETEVRMLGTRSQT
jgi:UDP-N-acetylmuramate dehydrogenase